MNELNQKTHFHSRIGLDRNRLLTVMALCLILVVVLFVQFRNPPSAASTAVTQQTSLERQSDTGKSERGNSVIARKAAHARQKGRELKTNPVGLKPGKNPARPADLPAVSARPVPSKVSEKKWSVVDPGEMELQDPFGLPAEIVELQQAKKEKENREAEIRVANIRLLAEKQRQAQAKQVMFNLQQQGVRFVFVSGKERVAQIGSRVFKVGDVIDGVRISQIQPSGSVILEIVEAELDSVDLPR